MAHPTGPLVAAHRRAIFLSITAGLVAAGIGAVVLCGWIWNIEPIKSVYGPITMKTNAAIGVLLCGTALTAVRRLPRLAGACSIGAGLIGAATLAQHLAGWDLGIDQLLFTEEPGAAATASPNRMGPNASLTFVLAGSAIALLARGGERAAARAQALAAAGLVLALVPVAGYLYGAEQLYGIARYTGIALHTALAFLALHTGILMARPALGPVAVALADSPAGTMLRRLALPVLALPLALGYLEIYARNAELVDRGLGIALYAVSLIIVLGITVWYTARAIEHSDRARRRAERDRDLLILSERAARAEAERASEVKDQFLATLSHELRTPLNVMLGWTQVLERGARPDEHVRIAGLVAKNGRLLARLVEDLLDISRVTQGHFEISRSPTGMNPVVQTTLDAMGAAAADRGIQIVCELDPRMPPIDADAARLQQIIGNLLSNAVKFTGTGGRITVRTACAGGEAVLTVSDTGIGFDESFASDLFKPFRQADATASREHGGLGLGLSIARHLAVLHGGSLEGRSEGPGRGATFTLRLPAPTTSVPAVDQEDYLVT